MARFSRLRRSAALFLLTAGFNSLAANSAWSCIGAAESSPQIVTTSKAVAVDAYISGFKTMVAISATQQYGDRPTLKNGKTMAEIILKQHSAEGKNFLGLDFTWTDNSPAEVVCAQLSSHCYDTAREIDLELLSLKFRAAEEIETVAKAHCREFAVNAELCGSILVTAKYGALTPGSTTVTDGLSVQWPTFAFTTVTTEVSSEWLSPFQAQAAGMESARQLVQLTSPMPLVLHQIGADGLERIGIDFELAPRIIIGEEEENLLGVAVNDAPPAPRTLAALLVGAGTCRSPKLHCVQIAPADYIQVTAYHAVTSSYRALLDMPFSMDKLLTLQVEVSPLVEPGVPGVAGCFGPVPLEQPPLRMSSLTQERMLRHLATSAEACAEQTLPAAPAVLGIPEIHSWKQLQAQHSDAPPAENPEADLVPESGIEPQPEEFVQQLPPGSDVPLLNPPAVAAVSPTMSPLEYAEVFLTQAQRENLPEGTEILLSEHRALAGQGAILDSDEDHVMVIKGGSAHQDSQVQLTAHDEPVKTCDSPLLRALGGPISVTACESETCKGFVIQFAPCLSTPCEKQAAEIAAFDGPAQIILHDGPCKCGSGLTAQPAACEETLDELAQRLERDFLRRAVAGQIQIPETCQGECAPANSCPPGPFAERGTPGIALPDPVGMVKLPAPGDKASTCPAGTCAIPDCPGCPVGSPCCTGTACNQAAAPVNLPWPLASNPGICGNIVLDPFACSAPATCVAAAVPMPGVAACCNANNQASAAGCQCAACPKGCGGECCCAKKDRAPVPAVTINPFVGGTPMIPAAMAPAPQVAMVPQAPPGAYAPVARAPQFPVAPAMPVMAAPRAAVNPELLDTYRDISRTLDQLAERCEAQAMFDKADELRDLAQEYRMSARVVHQHLNAMMPMPMPAVQPVAWYPAPPMMPYPMPMPQPAPPTYAPEPIPTFGPPAAPTTPAAQPLPIAQPMMVPRY